VLLFLLSGGTSLVYESIWARQLHLVVGTSQLAIAIVLAAFMAGLALGGLAAARWASLVRRPLVAFATLEAFVALYALGFGWMIDPATRIYLAMSSALSEYSAGLAISEFIVLGALLLPPTACMGATLPLLARFASSDDSDAGTQVGRLYGANTIGAVLGTGIAGFFLLPRLGLEATTWCTAAANGVVALGALALARRDQALPGDRPAPAPAEEFAPTQEGVSTAPLLAISALAGFASLLCEVAWFRLMTLILGGSAYSFSVMLLAFLLGIGLGGWVGGSQSDRVFAKSGRFAVLRWLAALQLGVALASWGAMFAYGELPYLFVSLFAKVQGSPLVLFGATLSIALGVMLVPALLMGASFPFLVRVASGDGTQLSRPVGRLYGANTAGGILGASLGGLVLLPTLQMTGSILAAASINFVAAAIAMTLAAPAHLFGRRMVGFGLAVVACVGLVHWQRPAWDPLLMSSGMYQYVARLADYSREGIRDFAVDPFDLLLYEEGRSSVVTVARSRNTGDIWLANNGKVDASSGADMSTQVILAQLPLLLGQRPDKALVIGLASGVSAGSLLLDGRLEQLDIAELEPAMVRGSHFFDEVNNRPLEDPRTHLHLNDARNHLMRTPDAYYDLVVSEPSNPWISGVSNLFTREFFALGRSKLSLRGVWVQWLHIYHMEPRDLRSLLATFADVYPHVGVFRVGEADLVLIGAGHPLDMNVATVDEYVGQSKAIVDDLNRVGFSSAEDIVSLYQFGRDALLRLAGDVELNTDDNMRIEYAAPLALHARTSSANATMLEKAAEIPYEAVREERLGKLAHSYARRDFGWNRALQTITRATRLLPEDLALAELHTQLYDAARRPRSAPES
jgi:predicted membrane-bound spermidine synthase